MVAITHPIATPKKGNASGSATAGEVTAGRFIELKAHPTTTQTGQNLVAKITGVQSGSRTEILLKIKKGLDFAVIAQLEHELQASQKELAQALSIPITTLARRKKEGCLHADESDRVVRLAQLKDAALALMQGDNSAAISWLRTPLAILAGETPLEHASTELGARDVEDLIGRLRYGVFS